MRPALVTLAFLTLTTPAFAMDGANTDTGDSVTVDDTTVFTVGASIPVFDSDGNETDYIVQTVTQADKLVDVDMADPDSGDVTTFEFSQP